jgi:TolB-like protein
MNIKTSSRGMGLLLGLMLAASCMKAGAAGPKYTIQAEGEGPTRQLAIIDAIKQALMQTEGGSLVAIERLKNEENSHFSSRNGVGQSSQTSDDKFQRDIQSATSGRIAGYDIISASQGGGNSWTVVINAILNKYDTPGNSPDSRRKLAILPFRTHNGSYQLDGAALAGAAIADRLGQRLVTTFTQSRKFAVVDRDYTNEYLKEVDFIQSGNAPSSELVKIGQALGVDYLIVGAIEEFSGRLVTRHQAITNRRLSYYEGAAIASYRILVMATRQIKWSDTIRLDLGAVPDGGPEARLDMAVTEIARAIGDQALENIYPVKIADIDMETGDVIIGRGGESIQPGDRFDAMSVSDKVIIDPDTGEPLERRETSVALLEITRVGAKMSYARILQGDIARLKAGDIARRKPASASQPAPEAPPPGVRFPGDR